MARADDEDPHALLSETIYQDLRALAGQAMRSERPQHTLQPTALVHEVYLRLAKADPTVVDRQHFLALAATQMRRVLVDSARSRLRQKRRPGDGRRLLPLEGDLDVLAPGPAETDDDSDQVLALDQALSRLASVAPRRAQMVELRYFAGLSVQEVASFQGISTRTALRDWKLARLFLQQAIEEARAD